jgi:hypothetical protein
LNQILRRQTSRSHYGSKVPAVTVTVKLISQQKDKISQQPENWEHRNDPDLVQAFPKKWWVESDFTVPNFPLPLRLKGSVCHYYSILNNTGTK